MQHNLIMTIEQLTNAWHMGTVSFAEWIKALTSMGVESVRADYRLARLAFFMPDGGGMALTLPVPDDVVIAEGFDGDGVAAAVRGSVKHGQLLARTMAAGCIGYWVWIAGGHVTYFGRRGEVHDERLA